LIWFSDTLESNIIMYGVISSNLSLIFFIQSYSRKLSIYTKWTTDLVASSMIGRFKIDPWCDHILNVVRCKCIANHWYNKQLILIKLQHMHYPSLCFNKCKFGLNCDFPVYYILAKPELSFLYFRVHSTQWLTQTVTVRPMLAVSILFCEATIWNDIY
jgi:hypothetical protein